MTAEDFALSNSPKLEGLLNAQQAASQALDQSLHAANERLAELGRKTDLDHLIQALQEAEMLLGKYRQYAEKLTEVTLRQDKQQEQLDTLKQRLAQLLAAIHLPDAADDLPAVLSNAREDVGRAAQIQAKIDFCMRLALVDTLFEKEQPFLILDDPFVNLDALRLEKALELLNIMAANKQIVYFVCHPIRAIETEGAAASRAEFLKLAEATRATIQSARAKSARSDAVSRKSPREMYRVVKSAASYAFRPANLNATITNNIFSMPFVINDITPPKDGSFEVFFIDAKGHVLNDRQVIEISSGKLSTERVQFCLNTRDDSGNEYELMIRESGQEDYEVVARYSFRAKLAFTGTFNFDF